MITQTQDKDPVAASLDEAARYNVRAKASPPEHRRSLYAKKDAALESAILAAPGQFFIDVVQLRPPMLGISHACSGRRCHLLLASASDKMRHALLTLPRRISSEGESDLMLALAGEGAR